MSRLRSRIARLERKAPPTPFAQDTEFVSYCRFADESDADFVARTGYTSGPDDVEITVTMKFDTELDPPTS